MEPRTEPGGKSLSSRPEGLGSQVRHESAQTPWIASVPDADKFQRNESDRDFGPKLYRLRPGAAMSLGRLFRSGGLYVLLVALATQVITPRKQGLASNGVLRLQRG